MNEVASDPKPIKIGIYRERGGGERERERERDKQMDR